MRIKGYVRWFSDATGEGCVRDFDNNDWFLHWSEIPGAKFGQDKQTEDFVSIAENQLVTFIAGECSMGRACTKLRLIVDKNNEVESHSLLNILDWLYNMQTELNRLEILDPELSPTYRRVNDRLKKMLK